MKWPSLGNFRYRIFCGGLLLVAMAGEAQSAVCTASVTGAWSTKATWGAVGGCAGAGTGLGETAGIPGVNDSVTVNAAVRVTLTANAKATTITINAASAGAPALAGTPTNGIDLAGFTLNVSGAIALNTAATSGTFTDLTVGSGTLTAASIAITGGNLTKAARVTVGSGNITTTGSITFPGGTAANNIFTSTGASTVNIGGSFGSGGTLTTTAGAVGVGTTFIFNGGAAQTIGTYTTYNNIDIQNTSGGVTLTGTTTIGGTLTVTKGTMSVGAFSLSVTGATTVKGVAPAGTLDFTSTTGTKIFTGNVTIDNGGTWSNAIGEGFTFQGGITNNGSFTNAGGGAVIFNTNSQTFDGANTISFGGAVTVTGAITVTNLNTNATSGVTIPGVLTGTVAGSTWVNGDGTALNCILTYNNATAPMGTGVFTASANPNTVIYGLAGAQTIKAVTYNNLTLNGSGNKSPGASFAVNGTLTVNTAAVLAPTALQVISGTAGLTGTGTVQVTRTGTAAGDFAAQYTISGTKTLTNLTVVYQGAATQFIDGLSYGNLTMNNASGATLVADASVSGVLTFTLGNITTGSFTLTDSANCATHVRTAGYVIGTIKMHIPAGASTCVFELGAGANYLPISVTFAAGTTAGDVTASTTAGDHGSIATSGLDSTQSINRYWTLTNGSGANAVGTGTGYSATFTWVAATDQDAGINTAALRVARFASSAWNSSTVTATTATTIMIGSETRFGDFAAGEIVGYNGTLGRFNAYTVLAGGSTVQGYITTQVAGTAFTLTIAHLNTAGTALQTFGAPNGTITVTISLVDGTTQTAPIVNGNCYTNWTTATPITTTTVSFNKTVDTTVTTGAITVPNSYKNVRVYITGNGEAGCSSDAFAIRPASLTVSALDANWTTTGTTRTLDNTTASGGKVHAAGTSAITRPFTLRATAINSAAVAATTTNYNGSPTAVSGFPTCGTLCTTVGTLSFTAGSWTNPVAGSGVRENATANYSEAGTFNLQLEDQAYASVDLYDGTTTAQRTIPATASVEIGRFVPDHFAVATNNTPQFKTFNSTCASRSFTYIGQPFGYVTTPIAKVTAQNAANATTTNYANALWKIDTPDTMVKGCTTSPDVCTVTLSKTVVAASRDSSVTHKYSYATTPTVTPNWDNSQVSFPFPTVTANNDGTGTITGNGDLLAFKRSLVTPQSLFTANITLTESVQDDSENKDGSGNLIPGNGIISTATSAAFNNIAFDSGNEFRYGKLKLSNAHGSELLNLPIPMETQYWNGNVFVTNAADNCTTISSASNIVFGNYKGGISPANMVSPGNVSLGSAFTAGIGSLKLIKPSSAPAQKGSVDVTANLTAESKAYLKSGTTFSSDPTVRATFGIYKSGPVIYLREMY